MWGVLEKKLKDAVGQEYLTQIYVDRVHAGTKICAYRSATAQELRDYVKYFDPSASPEKIQQRVNGYIRASQAIARLIPNDAFLNDAYLSIYLVANPDDLDTWTWRLFSVEDGDVSAWIRDLRIPTQ